ncbi:hypothetical protein G8S49_05990 [Clostridium botulinum C]|uniref:Uncharacterized protein n=1 Tax=Clostridium botulinum C TaxID=36828 RepID=A0A9Q3YZA3_CLOBO|nr:hypothetical protein [Clostridium botulinum]MCD3194817.1 hypothetical protein [Clostridium botulinum C]MCD3200248.1 hypothetical protein [Clostridium botulinum C]MCD3205685.1 hypothetical protein [Clostridium botulinum C]MCD3207480.1 hypothetical protein [Clostridium botulinum C]MCD3226214.1 hypothetical protein [Clostridium botulinum C]
MKRRIIYKENKTTKQTDILCMQVAEELEDVELKYLDMDYETDKNKFDRAKKFHIENGKVVFDELYDVNIIKAKELEKKNEILEKQKEKLENQLLLETNININKGGIL